MGIKRFILVFLGGLSIVCYSFGALRERVSLEVMIRLHRLQQAYPDHIKAISQKGLIWSDGTLMEFGVFDVQKTVNERLNNPVLFDQIMQPLYRPGSVESISDDPGRIRYEPFFRKMYGNSANEVESNLQDLEWMPGVFDKKYILRVTKINGIYDKLRAISDELETLVKDHPEWIVFLDNPGGTYCWRFIAHTSRLSNHSFGMTLDINADRSQYWQWDLALEGRKIAEEVPLVYRNTVPIEIVRIFEKHGFIWGGKWYHYDTMHFEYRPELFVE
jgi:hypothetical protein